MFAAYNTIMDSERVWDLVTNPVWRPLTNVDMPGYVVLAVCAAVLIGLTLWTYLGSVQTTPRRLFILVFLRLLALLIALLSALRPTITVTEHPRQKSTLVILLDLSASMQVTDEYDKLSRYEVMRRNIEKCEPLLKQLQNDQEVTVHIYGFSSKFDAAAEQFKPLTDDNKPVSIADWLKSRKPDGKRTDFGGMLAELYKKYQGDTNPLRGMIIVSDGGNNVIDPDPTVQATRWRGINCPIYTFMVGKTDTKPDQKDIGFTSIVADPAPVAVKADLTARATLKAAGLEGANVKIRLTLSRRNAETKKWEEIPELTRISDPIPLPKSTGNEIEITTKAPDKPGQVRVKLEIIEGPSEDRIQENNQISTFVTVTKDGVRVLLIDQTRLEVRFIHEALATDKRFDVVQMIRQTDDPPPPGEAAKFDVMNEAYDVIILGDVSPARLNAVNPNLMANIAKLVTEKGVGFMMMGGIDSFGGTPGFPGSDGWKNTPIADILPVEIPDKTPQADDPPGLPVGTQIDVLKDAFDQYIMKLDPDSKKNRQIWEKLGETSVTRLGGYTVIGKPKPRARVYAMAKRVGAGDSSELLVGSTNVGRNDARVLAFGADQTWKWRNLDPENEEGIKLHARFWKQVALWLAHQDEVDGSVYVRTNLGRQAVNSKNSGDMGIKDKHGDDVVGPIMRYQVLRASEEPDESKAKPAERGERNRPRWFYESKEPGEYRVVVWGEGKGDDGKEIKGQAEAWFDVYPEISDELVDPSAKDTFLLALESTARGTAPETVRKADKLPSFIKEELVDKPLRQTNLRARLHPDWRRNGNPWFLPMLLVAFTAILALEWGLRRVWGMV